MSDDRLVRLSRAAVEEHDLGCPNPKATCERRAILVAHANKAVVMAGSSFAVWDSEAGGFLSQASTWADAWSDLEYLVRAEGADRADLDVIATCPDHLDQPAGSCDVCDHDE